MAGKGKALTSCEEGSEDGEWSEEERREVEGVRGEDLGLAAEGGMGEDAQGVGVPPGPKNQGTVRLALSTATKQVVQGRKGA